MFLSAVLSLHYLPSYVLLCLQVILFIRNKLAWVLAGNTWSPLLVTEEMVVSVLAAEPEGAFPMPCTAWAKQGAVERLFWIHPFLPKWATSSWLLPMFAVCCCAHLLLISFSIMEMLQGWTQAGMSSGLGCFTLANIRELIQASSLLTAWSTDYFICVTLQGSTKAHEPGFLLFTDWFWHFSAVVANLWLWLKEQDCFLIHQEDLHHPVSREVVFYSGDTSAPQPALPRMFSLSP